ncbi:DUF4870 domain-containing protein [Sinomicrobium kalidii]|uniref:DUF4870 domain-containing protein n=1 Tax=Sinomicrobium kalidii TaxID=2900738 RepID=UPI001E2FEE4E|nr:DUF4870 domain-containing protein [Sinomicrobium kalidii]UGU18101.1 DUF4870 domain-containing protein [Sinomicrobium kalidii]
MCGQNLGNIVKNLRRSQGVSQELLAEESGLSIRIIQRIEKGETTPNGDTCRKLSDALKVTPNELMNWKQIEDIDFLKKLNLSALTFIFFPLLGILVPSLVWISKKDKIKDLDIVAKKLINFEITWTILFFFMPFLITPLLYMTIEIFLQIFNIDIHFKQNHWADAQLIWIIMYVINIVFIVINAFRIHDGKELKYFPSIRFLKN